MRRKLRVILWLIFLAIVLSGCATWQLVRKSTFWKGGDFSATLPEGWMKFASPTDLLFLTKDGSLLQHIRFYSFRIGKELPVTKKKFSDDMLVHEIAELTINEISLDKENVHNFNLLSNTPVNISGIEGFRLEYSFYTPYRMETRAVHYGFKKGKNIYFIKYIAAAQHYYNKNLDAFENFIKSYKIRGKR